MFFAKDKLIEELKNQNRQLRADLERERQRADLAVDRLLATQAHISPIMPEMVKKNELLEEEAERKAKEIKSAFEKIGMDIDIESEEGI